MPLLRLASLILASLLVAALSALAPGAVKPGSSVSDQAPAHGASTTLVAAAMAAPRHPGLDAGFSSLRQNGPELVRATGQSVPETGQ